MVNSKICRTQTEIFIFFYYLCFCLVLARLDFPRLSFPPDELSEFAFLYCVFKGFFFFWEIMTDGQRLVFWKV